MPPPPPGGASPPPPLQCGPRGNKYRGWHPTNDSNGVGYNFGGGNASVEAMPQEWRDQGEARIHPLRYAEWFEFSGQTGDDPCAAECRLVVDYPRPPDGEADHPRQYWKRYFYKTLDDCRACRQACCQRACCDGDNDDHFTWGCDVFRQKLALPSEPWWHSLEHGGVELSYDFEANRYNYFSYGDAHYESWPTDPWDTWSWIDEDQPWDKECDASELACSRRLEVEQPQEPQKPQEPQEARPRRQLTADQTDTCQVLVWRFPEVATTADCFLSFYNLEHRVPEHERRIGNEAYVCIADAFEPPPPPPPPHGSLAVVDIELEVPAHSSASLQCTPEKLLTFPNGANLGTQYPLLYYYATDANAAADSCQESYQEVAAFGEGGSWVPVELQGNQLPDLPAGVTGVFDAWPHTHDDGVTRHYLRVSHVHSAGQANCTLYYRQPASQSNHDLTDAYADINSAWPAVALDGSPVVPSCT